MTLQQRTSGITKNGVIALLCIEQRREEDAEYRAGLEGFMEGFREDGASSAFEAIYPRANYSISINIRIKKESTDRYTYEASLDKKYDNKVWCNII